MEHETISVSRAETRKRENPAFHKQKMLWPETLSIRSAARVAENPDRAITQRLLHISKELSTEPWGKWAQFTDPDGNEFGIWAPAW